MGAHGLRRVDADGGATPIRVRSMVGLLPLMAVANEPDWVPEELTDFTSRLAWLRRHRPDLTDALLQVRRGDEQARWELVTT